jgi:MFS family permease
MRNTGRFNVAQGAVITAQSIGAALSTTLAGFVVVGAGYSAAFITLGAVAAIGAVTCLLALPETRQTADGAPRPRGKTAAPASAIAAE